MKARSLSKKSIRDFQEEGYAIHFINSMLAALNQFLQFVGLHEYRVRQLRLQRKYFCGQKRKTTEPRLHMGTDERMDGNVFEYLVAAV